MPDRRDELPVEVDYPRSAHLLDEEDDDLWSLARRHRRRPPVMTTRFSAVAPAAYVAHRLSAIDFHLDRLAKGRDPYGHLLAIERLARAARAEWTAVEAMRAGPPAGDSA
jgi:hypothetical protein